MRDTRIKKQGICVCMYVCAACKEKKIGEGQREKKKCCKREAYSMIRSSQYWAFGSFFTFLICLSKRVDMINGHLILSLDLGFQLSDEYRILCL